MASYLLAFSLGDGVMNSYTIKKDASYGDQQSSFKCSISGLAVLYSSPSFDGLDHCCF